MQVRFLLLAYIKRVPSVIQKVPVFFRVKVYASRFSHDMHILKRSVSHFFKCRTDAGRKNIQQHIRCRQTVPRLCGTARIYHQHIADSLNRTDM